MYDYVLKCLGEAKLVLSAFPDMNYAIPEGAFLIAKNNDILYIIGGRVPQ